MRAHEPSTSTHVAAREALPWATPTAHGTRHGLVRWHGARVMYERLDELELSMFGTAVWMETDGKPTRGRLQDAERMFQACRLLRLAADMVSTVKHDE